MLKPNAVPDPVRQQGLASVTHAAAFLSLSRNKLYQLINAGEIPSKKFGKSVRVPWAWLNAQAAVASDEGEVGL